MSLLLRDYKVLAILFIIMSCQSNKNRTNMSNTLPKIELHLHLDCSLSYDIVKKIAPNITEDVYKASFIAPPKCTDLADYIERAISGVKLMQTKEQLKLVTLDLFDQLKKDNVIYAEIRFAPLIHLDKGLTPEEVVETVNDAMTIGMETSGVKAGLILCTLRHFSEEQSMRTIKLVEQFKGTNVVGFDIAADEAGFPIANHVTAFQRAKRKNISCTAHAGEAKGPESVWETLNNLYPKRIGHGVRSYEDKNLVNFLKEKNIHLEVCPTSNIQTNVYDRLEDHKINEIYNEGLSMSVNTDARTISNTTLENEYTILKDKFGWTKMHFFKCNMEAIDHAFTSNEIKAEIKSKLIEAYQK